MFQKEKFELLSTLKLEAGRVLISGLTRPGSCPFSGGHDGQQDGVRQQGRSVPFLGIYPTDTLAKVVKPHTPLIRFPDRRDNPKPNVSEVLRSAGLPSHPSSISQHSKGSKSPDWLMHQGPPDTAEIIKTLPQKYRRKPMSQEEMEFIQRGGPE
ncbi:alpha-ketoglutarate dehydrogenase component 4 [Diceros bicornis minor]|uniref:alpha-ketoglutarate dehydrogenase component 4 n=1 Tax=Diceros bicornis minor TaxID=77932 RepID=UPI0026EA6B2F|nr:alpha-ketoglutarate dehydrogenase component 4 [Diceros bicornis minor]